jgi:hypothetical protein
VHCCPEGLIHQATNRSELYSECDETGHLLMFSFRFELFQRYNRIRLVPA